MVNYIIIGQIHFFDKLFVSQNYPQNGIQLDDKELNVQK